MDPLRDLQEWFASVCNGDWEHTFGVTIQTLDNPGWSVDIDLQDTELEGRDFTPVTIERTERDWLHCFVRDGRFAIRCGSSNLEEALGHFTRWSGAATFS